MSLQLNHRSNTKSEFLKSFQKVKQLKAWKALEHKFQFRIEILTTKHMNDVIRIGCKQFSILGGGYPGILCNLSPQDCHSMISLRTQHAVETGLSIVVLDKNGTLCFAGLGVDFLDYFPKLNINDVSLKMKKRMEFSHALFSNDPFYQNLISQQKTGKLKHGDCIMGMAMSKPGGTDLKGYQFGMLFYILLIGFASSTKYYFADFAHPNSVKYSEKNWSKLALIKGLKYRVSSRFNLNAFIENDEFYSRNALKMNLMGGGKSCVCVLMQIECGKAQDLWSLESISKILLSPFLRSAKL